MNIFIPLIIERLNSNELDLCDIRQTPHSFENPIYLFDKCITNMHIDFIMHIGVSVKDNMNKARCILTSISFFYFSIENHICTISNIRNSRLVSKPVLFSKWINLYCTGNLLCPL